MVLIILKEAIIRIKVRRRKVTHFFYRNHPEVYILLLKTVLHLGRFSEPLSYLTRYFPHVSSGDGLYLQRGGF